MKQYRERGEALARDRSIQIFRSDTEVVWNVRERTACGD